MQKCYSLLSSDKIYEKTLEQAKGRAGAGADTQFSKTTRVGSTGRETWRKP